MFKYLSDTQIHWTSGCIVNGCTKRDSVCYHKNDKADIYTILSLDDSGEIGRKVYRISVASAPLFTEAKR